MFCSNCGSEINGNFCSNCGANINENGNVQQPINITNTNMNTNLYQYERKNKWIAFFLCLFLGFIGAHRFYVGKAGTGIIWLFTLGLFGIGILVDLILILMGSFRDKAGQPLIS